MKAPETTHRHWWMYSDLGHHWCDGTDDQGIPCDLPEEAMYHDFPCDFENTHNPDDHT